tara:strand:- start:8 stop:325 length:318 start_codon:yes stop_codon:yes gene_type:complete
MSESNTEKNNDWKNREMGALWRREGKQQNFLSGMIKTEDEFGMHKETKVVVFTNKGKSKNEKAPDFIIYEDRPREDAPEVVAQKSDDSEVVAQKSDDSEEVPAGF